MATLVRYGANVVKTLRCSPDAWAQAAFQLAYYRMYKRMVATYEPAQMRSFRTGRTECIRVATSEMENFVKGVTELGISAVCGGLISSVFHLQLNRSFSGDQFTLEEPA